MQSTLQAYWMGDLNTPAGLMGHSYITGIATRPWTSLCYIPTLRSLQFCTQANSSHFHDQPLAPAVKGKKGMREARATFTLRAHAFCPQVFFFPQACIFFSSPQDSCKTATVRPIWGTPFLLFERNARWWLHLTVAGGTVEGFSRPFWLTRYGIGMTLPLR